MSTMKENWMAAFQPNRPNALYGRPLIYTTGEFGTSIGPARITRLNATGDMTAQLARAAALGFYFAILENADGIAFGDVQNIATKAHGFGIGIVAINPTRTGNPLAYVAHPNVYAVIVEPGNGSPADYDALRKRAWRDGIIPVWFVNGDQAAAQQTANQIKAGPFKGIGVLCGDRVILAPDV